MSTVFDLFVSEQKNSINNLLIDFSKFFLEKYSISNVDPESVVSEWSGFVVSQEKQRRSRSVRSTAGVSTKSSKSEEHVRRVDGYAIPLKLYPELPDTKQLKQFIKADVFTALDDAVKKSICNWNFTKSKDNPNTYCGGFPVDENSMCATCCKKSSKNKKTDEVNGLIDEKSCIAGLSVDVPDVGTSVNAKLVTELRLNKTTVEGVFMANNFLINKVLIKIVNDEKIAMGIVSGVDCTTNEVVTTLPDNWRSVMQEVPADTAKRLKNYNISVNDTKASEEIKSFVMEDLV